MKVSGLSLLTITIIQITIAVIISLIFQFLIPFSWHPLDTFQHGIKQHGDEGVNFVIFTISQWYFSFSVAWLIYQDNPYLNNFLVYSLAPLGIIVSYEFFFIFLFYDYIHLIPLLLSIYLIWKKKETLRQKFAPFIILLNTIWLFSVYFLKLAYYREDLSVFIRNYLVYLVLWIGLSFLFRNKRIE